MLRQKEGRQVSLPEAVIVLAAVLLFLGFSMIFVPGAAPQAAILLAVIGLIVYGRVRGVGFDALQKGMAEAVHTSMGAIYLFFFIGVLISALMASGAIPTMMYYGLRLISPKTFYLSAFVLSAVVGTAIGSSLTTVSTVGVALMGMGQAMGASPAVTAGAVVSGAFLGDKMSPLSDTTGIAASIVGVDLFAHIQNMLKTTVPAFLISGAFYLVLSLFPGGGTAEGTAAFEAALRDTGLVSPLSLLPLAVLIGAAAIKVPSVLSMLLASAVGLALSALHRPLSVNRLFSLLYSGFSMDGLPDAVAPLLLRGGISSMFFTITMVILALSLGGLLFSLGIVGTVLDRVQHRLDSALKATLAVAASGVLINFIVGEQYLSILLTGETFKGVYDRLGLKPANLSRALEDAGTVINPLVPWSVCGTFIAAALGVPVFAYLPFAMFCYLCVALTVLSGITGKGISKK